MHIQATFSRKKAVRSMECQLETFFLYFAIIIQETFKHVMFVSIFKILSHVQCISTCNKLLVKKAIFL